MFRLGCDGGGLWAKMKESTWNINHIPTSMAQWLEFLIKIVFSPVDGTLKHFSWNKIVEKYTDFFYPFIN